MMVSRTLFEEAYRREGIMDCSASSVLCHGRNNKTGAPVLVRHWLSARDLPEDAIQALHSEVAAWQACQHTHLLPFLDGFANEQGLYLVSASPSGGTLATRLAQHFLTVLPFDEALRIILQTGQALQALHQHGLSHGNLTPQAVFFDAAGQVCLGEGRLRSVLHCLPSNRPGLEESIPLCWYMAPEQFAGGWNALTDQYALGCLAYHVLTGRVPFTGSARATLRQKHEREQPAALRERHPSLPLSVESAVLKALAKQPEERHHSVQAFLDALQPPSKAHAGDLDRTAGPWMVGGVEITAQTTLIPEEFLSSSSPASPTSTESWKTAQTWWQRALAAGNQSWRQIAPRLALAVTRHSTSDRVSLTLPLRSPLASRSVCCMLLTGERGSFWGRRSC